MVDQVETVDQEALAAGSDDEFGLVQLGTKQIPLRPGSKKWIEVKLEIAYGDQLKMTDSGFGKVGQNWEFGISIEQMEVQRILSWVVDWNLTERKGDKEKPIPYNPETVRLLNPATARAINVALDKHMDEMAALKKVTSGETGSEPKS